MAKAQLHELLAVEGDREGQFKKITDEALNTFDKKEALFMGFHRTLRMFDETDKQEYPAEIKTLDTTVGDKLAYVLPVVERYFDALFQKESTNQMASADLVVDGVVIAERLPATFLLGMESRLRTLRSVFEAIPTLAPGVKWVPAEAEGRGVFVQDPPERTMKTAKTFKHKVLYEATAEHRAEIEKWEETMNVGEFTRQVYSGKITPLEKSNMLARMDSLIQAVKKARQRANTQEVTTTKVAKKILEYIMPY